MNDRLKQKIVTIILKLGDITFEDLIRELNLKGRDLWRARKALSQLVSEGVIERIPDYARRRIVFSVKRVN